MYLLRGKQVADIQPTHLAGLININARDVLYAHSMNLQITAMINRVGDSVRQGSQIER
ncbi:hypothetical protein [Yoonia algicola]|uniref:Uncharacterized protein n=1 Tax=Yoonia algicola TaxID=3137368 RepID=A0AAN0NIS6_9RHOB